MPKLPNPNNPLQRWFDSRKEYRADLEKQAAQMIAKEIEAHTFKLIDELSSVDFLHSRLPKEILERREAVEHDCGWLEHTTKSLIQMIRDNDQRILVDIRPIDQKLMTLVFMFKYSVDHGEATAAEIGLSALNRGIRDIRCKTPRNRSEFADAFVHVNTKHLHQWIKLVEMAQIYDHQTQNLTNMRQRYESNSLNLQRQFEALHQKILCDCDYADAFTSFMKEDTSTAWTDYTKAQQDVSSDLLNLRIDEQALKVLGLDLLNLELKQHITQQNLTTLKMQLTDVPIVSEPKLADKYQEAVNGPHTYFTIQDMFQDDRTALTDEIQGLLDDRHQCSKTPQTITIRAPKSLLQSAKHCLDVIRKKQNASQTQSESSQECTLEEMEISTEAEQTAECKRAQQAAERKSVEEMSVQVTASELYGEDFVRRFFSSQSTPD